LVSLPIITKIPRMAAYFYKFLTHSGYYGEGATGLASAVTLKSNLSDVINQEPFLFVVLIVYIGLLFFSWCERVKNDAPALPMFRMVLLSGWITIVAECALVVQHYRTHYLVPALMQTGFLIGIIVAYYKNRVSRSVGIPLASCVLLGLWG